MRHTPLLESVLEILTLSHQPLSVPEILTTLAKKNLTPNKTTLYRMLDKLIEQEKVAALILDPKITYYEIKTYDHHHFVCKNCETVKCFHDADLVSEIQKLSIKLADKGIAVQEHQVSLSGTCSDCK